MGTLLVERLHLNAKLPTEPAHPGEDLGYDIYALEDTFLQPNKPVIVKTGVAAVFVDDHHLLEAPETFQLLEYNATLPKWGLEVEDRSGMAAKHGIHILAGKVDAGYRDGIGVVMILLGPAKHVHPEDVDRVRGLLIDPFQDIDTISEELAYTLSHSHIARVGYLIKAGDKFAQLLPRKIEASAVREVAELPAGARGLNGYGSTGR